MAQAIVTWCDQHLERGEHVPATTWHFTVKAPEGRTTTYAIDACESCAKPFTELVTFLNDLGRTSDERGKPLAALAPGAKAGRPPMPGSREPMACPSCGHMSPNRSALASHVRAQHKTTLARLAGEPEPYTCPHCEFASVRQQGLGAHIKSAHPGEPTTPGEAGAS